MDWPDGLKSAVRNAVSVDTTVFDGAARPVKQIIRRGAGFTRRYVIDTWYFVCRPNLVGALVVKAAAHGNPSDLARRRHRQDFVVLAGLLTAEDFAAEKVNATDRRRLRAIVSSVMGDQELLLEIPDAQIAINRLTTAAELDE